MSEFDEIAGLISWAIIQSANQHENAEAQALNAPGIEPPLVSPNAENESHHIKRKP